MTTKTRALVELSEKRRLSMSMHAARIADLRPPTPAASAASLPHTRN